MIDDGVRHVETFPACKSSAQSQVNVIGIGKKTLIERTDLIEHGLAVQTGAAAREQDILLLIVLPLIDLQPSPSPRKTIPIQQETGIVDHLR